MTRRPQEAIPRQSARSGGVGARSPAAAGILSAVRAAARVCRRPAAVDGAPGRDQPGPAASGGDGAAHDTTAAVTRVAMSL